ncbi:2573_t:CDS:2 [Diversispora eburnea]|uniref:2573_t:CDS:1 n=1 Tax=Diversispora eburnea TaxID=1213867 RepID=A0A9N9D715_9GLOM|nr:2573_t:CDS:2 [Diversispora eburnea]
MERDPTTVCRFIAKYKKTGKTENLSRPGWSPALNNDEKDALVNEATKIRCAPLHEIINKLVISDEISMEIGKQS